MTNAKRAAKRRDDWECQFCGMDNDEHEEKYDRGLHAHHIVKEKDGGEDAPENYITVCRTCHRTIETTQADAISHLRKTILSEIDDSYLSESRLAEMIEESENETNSNTVVKDGGVYIHEWHGIVMVGGFDSEVIGADTSGEVKSVAVNYRRVDADDGLTLTEPIAQFIEQTGDAYDLVSEAASAEGSE